MAVSGKSGRASRAGRRKNGGAIQQGLVKSLTHSLRVEILSILNERVASPSELARELGEGLSQVSYHVKVLREHGCIELVRTEPRRGAVEHYYRATTGAFLGGRDWAALPDSVRPGLSAGLVQRMFGDAVRALETGSFDQRRDRHATHTRMRLDEAGWEDLVGLLERTLDGVLEIREQSARRLGASGEKGIPVAAELAGFELPEEPGRTLAGADAPGKPAPNDGGEPAGE